jgi:hypothetical protein
MKTSISLGLTLLLGSAGFVWGAPDDANQTVPPPTAYAVVGKDANSSVWEQTVYEFDPLGNPVPKTHHYTEVATGLHYQQNGQWLDSKEEIDIQPNGTASATQGQHQAYFPGDIYQGQIELMTPDGLQLNSRPMGLSYFDGTNIVLIAVLTNSIGQVLGANQVIYTNAFTGFAADLVYTYTKAGFEQDVVLREQPPTPESLGLNPDTARLQVLTEFFSPPQPTIQSMDTAPQAGLSLTDQSLGFGAMQMIPGRAFLLGENATEVGARVSKQWAILDGRQFLVEEVPVNAIVEGLATLPLPTPAVQTTSSKTKYIVSRHLTLPPQRLAKNSTKPIILAKTQVLTRGLVLDYQTVNSNQTNFTFQGDTTYYISGTVNLYGTNTFEGGTVIKYTNSSSAELKFNPSTTGSLWTFRTSPYHPAVFTCMNDNSVGEVISGSTGSPANTGATYLCLAYDNGGDGAPAIPVQHARFCYAGTAIFQENRVDCNPIVDCQFLHCTTALSEEVYAPFSTPVQKLRNVLMSACGTALFVIPSYSIIVDGENMTVDDPSGILLFEVSGSTITGTFTNSIFTGITNYLFAPYPFSVSGTVTFFDCATNSSGAGIYQTVGAGGYYLTDNTYRNVGTTNIDLALLASLGQKTTDPPIVYSGTTF